MNMQEVKQLIYKGEKVDIEWFRISSNFICLGNTRMGKTYIVWRHKFKSDYFNFENDFSGKIIKVIRKISRISRNNVKINK